MSSSSIGISGLCKSKVEGGLWVQNQPVCVCNLAINFFFFTLQTILLFFLISTHFKLFFKECFLVFVVKEASELAHVRLETQRHGLTVR
jgi:hypothetical protein